MNRVLVTVLFMVFHMSYVHAQQVISLGSAYGAPMTTPNKDGLFDLVYQELSKRLGIKIVIQNVDAGERVLLNANQGVDDGDVGRVAGLEKRYPNLVRIPVPIYRFQVVVFSKAVDFSVDGAKSIHPYDVGLLKGMKVAESISQGARSVTSLESVEQLFSMLDKDRIDVVIHDKAQGLSIIKKLGLNNIRLLQPNLMEDDLYLYLNNKHLNLIPRIESELQRMYKDGTIKGISDKVGRQYGL